MKSNSAAAPILCETCGKTVARPISPNLALCPACLLRASRTPEAVADVSGSAPSATNTWEETFPQWQFESNLRETEGECAFLVRVPDGARKERAVLQVVSGRAYESAGGVEALTTRSQLLGASRIEGLAPVLDFGDVEDAFFLLTASPELPVLPEAIAGKSAEELTVKFSGILAEAKLIVDAARHEKIGIHLVPETSFVDLESGEIVLTPSLLTDESPEGGERRGPRLTKLEPGIRLGQFRLLEKCGEGGFGEVWKAQQERPVQREVALKILKAGFHSQRARARFEVEQQALARLDHPHIARFFEGGTTADGRPYFAMEWIEGGSMTRFCEDTNASLEERLRLFREVGEAIHHAHQKGLIHRDLKPFNVMVTRNGGPATVKVIDFGIARAVEDPSFDQTQLTRADEIVGTPASMSPEQAVGTSGSDLDARTDVYGLGVLLYELLTGQLPFDPKRPPDELRRVIREEDPRKPSQRARGASLERQLKGDLDWITMRCLEKDPERRYASVSALLRDLERHEKNEPIEAGPPELAYRARKFVRRNRAAVLSAAAIFLVLVAATVISLKQAAYASSQEHAARVAEAQARERAAVAQAEKENSDHISSFLLSILESPHADQSGPEIKVVDLLDQAVRRLRADETILPERKAPLWRAVVEAYSSADLIEPAVELAAESLRFHQEALGPGDPGCLLAQVQWIRSYLWRRHWPEAERLSRELLANELATFPPVSKPVIQATSILASALYSQHRFDEGSDLLQDEIALLPDNHPESSALQLQLADALAQVDRVDESIELTLEVLKRHQANLGDHHSRTLDGIVTLAHHYQVAHRHRETVALLEPAIPHFESVFGPEHRSTRNAMLCLAFALREVGREEEAIAISREILAACQRSLGPDHSGTHQAVLHHAYQLVRLSRFDEAKDLLEPVLQKQRQVDGTIGEDALDTLLHLIPVYFEIGETVQAIALSREFQESLAKMQSRAQQDSATLPGSREVGGKVALPSSLPPAVGQAMLRTSQPIELPDQQWLSAWTRISYPLAREGAEELALPFEEALLRSFYRRIAQEDYRHRFTTSNVAAHYAALERWKDAILTQQEAIRMSDAQLSPGHPLSIEERIRLTIYLRKSGRVEEAGRAGESAHALAQLVFLSPSAILERTKESLALAEAEQRGDGRTAEKSAADRAARSDEMQRTIVPHLLQSAFKFLREKNWIVLRASGAVLASANDPTAYLELCHRIRQSADLAEPEKLPLGLLLLLPPASSQPDLVEAGVAMLEADIATNPDGQMAAINEALAAYRQGSHETAWAILESTPPHKNPHPICMFHLLRAMTAARLGKTDEARDALAVVRPLIDEQSEKIANGSGDERWSQWWYLNLYHHLFLKEATALIEDSE